MPTDPFLLDRIHNLMQNKNLRWTEKKMFGGHCFMMNEKMCFGTFRDGLMVRIAPEEIESLNERSGAEPMMQAGRAMKGYLFIKPEGFDDNKDLEFWIDKCVEFNPRAKSSKS